MSRAADSVVCCHLRWSHAGTISQRTEQDRGSGVWAMPTRSIVIITKSTPAPSAFIRFARDARREQVSFAACRGRPKERRRNGALASYPPAWFRKRPPGPRKRCGPETKEASQHEAGQVASLRNLHRFALQRRAWDSPGPFVASSLAIVVFAAKPRSRQPVANRRLFTVVAGWLGILSIVVSTVSAQFLAADFASARRCKSQPSSGNHSTMECLPRPHA